MITMAAPELVHVFEVHQLESVLVRAAAAHHCVDLRQDYQHLNIWKLNIWTSEQNMASEKCEHLDIWTHLNLSNRTSEYEIVKKWCNIVAHGVGSVLPVLHFHQMDLNHHLKLIEVQKEIFLCLSWWLWRRKNLENFEWDLIKTRRCCCHHHLLVFVIFVMINFFRVLVWNGYFIFSFLFTDGSLWITEMMDGDEFWWMD